MFFSLAFASGAGVACSSSEVDDTPGNGDSGGGDSQPAEAASGGPDATVALGEGGTDAVGDSPPQEAETDAGPDSDARLDGEGGSAGIQLPGNADYRIRIAANHTTSTFYAAWTNPGLDGGILTSGVSVIDAKTGTVRANIDVWATGSMAIDETNDVVYIPTVVGGNRAIAVVDGATNTQIQTIYQALGQTLDAGSGVVLSDLVITNLAADPAKHRLFALLGGSSQNVFVFEFDTSAGALIASIQTGLGGAGSGEGNQPGGGMVIDTNTHTLWVQTNVSVAIIDTTSLTKYAESPPSLPGPATDMTLDPALDQAVMFLEPWVGVRDGGSAFPQRDITIEVTTAGVISTAVTPPNNLGGLFGRIFGRKAYVYADDLNGTYYLLGFTLPDAGSWSFHGQSAALAHQSQDASLPQYALNAYSCEVVADSTTAYVVADMFYDIVYAGVPSTTPTNSLQYWALPLP